MSNADATADRAAHPATAGAKVTAQASEVAGVDAGDLSARAQAAAEEVRRRVGEASSVARDWATDQSDVLRDTVQTKPFLSIGVSAASAFAAGLVLGMLLARD